MQVVHVKEEKESDPMDEMTVEMMLAMNAAESIREISLDTLTPIEAMNELYKLKKMLS